MVRMGLNKSCDYKALVMTEMSRVTELYLRLKEYGTTLTPGFEEVFYNADRDLNYQTMLIISAVCNDDSDEDVNSNTKDIAEKGLDKVVEIAKLGIDHPDAAPFLNEQADRIERMVDGACENGKKNNDAANVIAENYAWTAILLVFTVVSVRLGLKYPESAAKLAKSLFNLPRK